MIKLLKILFKIFNKDNHRIYGNRDFDVIDGELYIAKRQLFSSSYVLIKAKNIREPVVELAKKVKIGRITDIQHGVYFGDPEFYINGDKRNWCKWTNDEEKRFLFEYLAPFARMQLASRLVSQL